MILDLLVSRSLEIYNYTMLNLSICILKLLCVYNAMGIVFCVFLVHYYQQ
jgi:hypothetical protein